jgi:nicotinamide mononucleotide (NMN) deamidase PncC
MVRDHLIPYLSAKFGVRPLGASLTVRFVGLGQSQIDQTLKEHIALPKDVMQTSQFEGGRVDFTFSVPGNDDADRQRLERLQFDLHKYLDRHIYADDATTSLEEAVSRRIRARGETIAVVEVGTGGALAADLMQVPSDCRVLTAASVAPRAEQLRRLLDIPLDDWPAAATAEQLELLAGATRDKAASDWAIAIGPAEEREGIDPPRVLVVIRTPAGQFLKHAIPWRGSNVDDYARLDTTLLELLRQAVAQP